MVQLIQSMNEEEHNAYFFPLPYSPDAFESDQETQSRSSSPSIHPSTVLGTPPSATLELSGEWEVDDHGAMHFCHLTEAVKRKASNDDLSSTELDIIDGSVKRLKLEHIQRVTGNVFIRANTEPDLPKHYVNFFTLVTESLFVDKTPALTVLNHHFRWHQPVLFRRPHGYGVPTFSSMVSSRFSWDYDLEPSIFSSLSVGPPDRDDELFEYDCLILALNFAAESIDPSCLMTSFSAYLRNKIAEFIAFYGRAFPSLYGLQLQTTSNNPGIIFRQFSTLLESLDSPPPFLLITNYTVLTGFNRDTTPNEHFTVRYFLRVVSECAPSFSGVLITGYDERCSPKEPFGRDLDQLPLLVDLTLHPGLQTACGFTKSEIFDLLDATQDLTLPGAPDFWEEASKRGIEPRAFFDPETYVRDWSSDYDFDDTVHLAYPMTDVLNLIARRISPQSRFPSCTLKTSMH